ncbi:MAG: hypothetical protein H0X38_03590 [Planctomycetes bacterium]|nr:hypothetical protein [Planctomycetota bacterium]
MTTYRPSLLSLAKLLAVTLLCVGGIAYGVVEGGIVIRNIAVGLTVISLVLLVSAILTRVTIDAEANAITVNRLTIDLARVAKVVPVIYPIRKQIITANLIGADGKVLLKVPLALYGKQDIAAMLALIESTIASNRAPRASL